MFVKTVKVKKLARIMGFILIALLIALAAVHIFNRFMEPKGIKIEDEAGQMEFLKGLGWEISPEPIDVRGVIIPEEWNGVYEDYNAIQLQQGFNLDKYRGKAADIYTYEVYNYDGGRQNVVANLVICDGKLIAGDVCCTELGGFMHGLAKVKDNPEGEQQKF